MSGAFLLDDHSAAAHKADRVSFLFSIRLILCSWLGGCYRFHLLGHPNSSFSTVVLHFPTSIFPFFREHPFYHPAFPIDSLLASWPTSRIKFLNSGGYPKSKKVRSAVAFIAYLLRASLVLGGSLVTIGSVPFLRFSAAAFSSRMNRAHTVFPPGPNSHRCRQART